MITSSSPFSSLNVAFSGLQAAQAALDVTSKNIASVGVDGYSRQRANTQAVPGVKNGAGIEFASGVTVASYERIRDSLLDRRFYEQAPLAADAEARHSLLGQIESAFAEPSDYGLQNLMDRFWNSWQTAGNSPVSEPARQAVIDRTRAMVDGIRSLAKQMEAVRGQIVDEQALQTDEINKLATTLADLNDDIQLTVIHGGSASDLKDQRDLIIDKLASYGNVTIADTTNGMVDVNFGTFALVSGVSAATATLPDLNTAVAGRMYALEDLRSNVIPGLQTQLDDLAAGIITTVNTLHTGGGHDLDGNPGGIIFTGTNASNINLSAGWEGDPRKLALGGSGLGSNSVAMAIAAAGDTAGVVGSKSIRGAYGSLVSRIGSLVDQARSNERVQILMTDAIRDKRAAVSAVSLDEEMSNLIKYQQSYAAAARAVSAIDQMLDVLVSRTGKVGL